MDIFLKILGGIALAVILLIAGIFLLYRWLIRRAFTGIVSTPATMALTVDSDPNWLRKDKVIRDLDALESCGYEWGSAYTIDNMPGVSFITLSHSATGCHGCYYDHAMAGNWADLCANFTDGIELTVCNAPQGHQMDTRPDTEKLFLSDKTVTELHSIFIERLAGREVQMVSPADIESELVSAYAKDMAWRRSKEGTSEAEFLRVAAEQENPLTEEQLKEAFKETKLQELRWWSGESIETFEKSTSISVAEWKKFEGRMIIFRESFHPQAYLDYLADSADLDEEAVGKYNMALEGGISLRGLLGRIASDTGYEFTKLGEIEQPNQTEIYGVKPPPGKEGDDD